MWENYISLDKTFAIDSVIYSDDFNHSKFVAYRTKDAIVDYFMEKYNKRPSVRVNNPDLYINIHISHNDCTLSIDSSGESLHKRGYRVDQTEAPLNEVLAAGMILKTGWKGDTNFVDPMCGSGTLLIEAAMIALNIAPGIHRKEFAFEKWIDFDQELFDRIYNDETQEREFKFKCYGSDINPTAIAIAEKNIRSAGLMKYVELKVMPFQQYTEAPQPGILVMNPPYGERISSRDLLGLYTMIGERLKHVFMGYNAWILSYNDECFEKIGLRPAEKVKLMNASLECEFRHYEIFEGKNKDFKKSLAESGERPERRDRNDRGNGGFARRERSDRPERNDRGPRPSFKQDRPERRFAAAHREDNDEFNNFLTEKGKHFNRRIQEGDKPFERRRMGERPNRSNDRPERRGETTFRKPFKKRDKDAADD